MSETPEERRCEHCGEILSRKTYANGKLETPQNYAGRRFCKHGCRAEWQSLYGSRTHPIPTPEEIQERVAEIRRKLGLPVGAD
jgi:hypothetical protein